MAAFNYAGKGDLERKNSLKTLKKDRKRGLREAPRKFLLTTPITLLESIGNAFHHIYLD